jgi:hypothetical protein
MLKANVYKIRDGDMQYKEKNVAPCMKYTL